MPRRARRWCCLPPLTIRAGQGAKLAFSIDEECGTKNIGRWCLLKIPIAPINLEFYEVDPVPLWSRCRNCGNQSGARHAEHTFGRSYRARICRPPRKARWARASLGSVLFLFCPALLHRFRELLPTRSSEAATSLGRRGLTGSLPYTPLCPASFHRL